MTEAEWLVCADPAAMLRLVTENPDHANIVCNRSARKLRLLIETGCEGCLRFVSEMPLLEAARYVATADCRSQAEHAAILRDIFGNPFRQFKKRCVCGNGWRDEKGWPRDSICPVCRGWHLDILEQYRGWHDGLVPKLARAIYDERAFDRMPILADALQEAGCQNEDILNHCRNLNRADGKWRRCRECGEIYPSIHKYSSCSNGSCEGSESDPAEHWIESDVPHVRGCWVIDLLLGKE